MTNRNHQAWLFLVLGFMGAVITSKLIGDLVYEVFQDLSQNLEPQRQLESPVLTDNRQPKSNDVIVAVIDTGIDTEQPLLKDQLWTNPGETGLDARGRDRSNNGIDDDGNGFIDDVHGWNFAADSKEIKDQHGHGTHIAGVIAALPDPNSKFHGLAPQAKIMSLKYYDAATPGLDNLRNSIRALRYAVHMGAQIINYSGGGIDANAEELEILREAKTRGILVVAAAGNEKSNCDHKPFYPANYGLPNIIAVAAIDSGSTLLPSSNFGRHSVDIAAPGNKIISTLPGGKLGAMTGTSQATAHVSGVAAEILLSRKGQKRISATELKRKIIQTVSRTAALEAKTASGGRVELSRALSMRDRESTLSDLQISQGDASHRVVFSPEFAEQASIQTKP